MSTQPSDSTDHTKLKVIPLFDSLKEQDLEYVANILDWPKPVPYYPPGTRIIEQGKANSRFFIIVEGEVSLIRKYGVVQVPLSTLKKYDFFGMTGLLEGKPPDVTVEATAQTTCFHIEKEQFEKMLARLPKVKDRIKTEAAHRSKALHSPSFPGLGGSEVALLVAHRDLIPQMWNSLPSLIVGNGLALALAVSAFLSASMWKENRSAWPWLLGAFAVALFTLVWVWHIIDWTNDYLVLTNQRIIHKEVFAFVREIRQEIPIAAVRNVSLETKGPILKLLGLADITIETIGGKIKFEYLHDAEHVQKSILGQLDMLKFAAKGEERDAVHKELRKALRPETQQVV